jgi:hypothetical protein
MWKYFGRNEDNLNPALWYHNHIHTPPSLKYPTSLLSISGSVGGNVLSYWYDYEIFQIYT